MTNSDLNRYRGVLEAKQAELVRLLRNRDGIAIEKCPDALDEVQHATERELVVRNLDRDSNLLRSVRGALRLIAEGQAAVPRWAASRETELFARAFHHDLSVAA